MRVHTPGMELPRGVITVLNTPFTSDGRLDADALARHARRALSAGVAGFLVPALAAEVYQLNPEERTTMMATARAEVDRWCAGGAGRQRPILIGGATAADAESRMAAARAARGCGCDAVLVALQEADGVVERLEEVVSVAGPMPVVLQDWEVSGRGLNLATIDTVAERFPTVLGLKIEVVPAGPKFSAVRERWGTRFHLSGGWTVMQLIEALDRGVDAFMPTGLHELYVVIDAAYRAGNRTAARAVFDRLLPVLAFSNQSLEISIRFFKRWCRAEGLYASELCRIEAPPFDEYQRRIADELIDYARHLTADATASNAAAGAQPVT